MSKTKEGISNLLKKRKRVDDNEILRYLEDIDNEGKNGTLMKRYECSVLQEALIAERSKEVILKLIELGGRELVMKEDSDGVTAFQTACENKASADVLLALLEVGGEKLVKKTSFDFILRRYTDANELLLKFIDVGGRKCIMYVDAFHLACRYHVSKEVLLKLIEVGGVELIMDKLDTGLHDACEFEPIPEVIEKILEIGGKKIVMQKTDYNGFTALHYLCREGISVELVEKLIEVGGKKLLMLKSNEGGHTALHLACGEWKASIDIVEKLIELGGRDLLVKNSDRGETALHLACQYKAPLRVVEKLIEAGKRKLIIKGDNHGNTALHSACQAGASVEVVSELIEFVGKELLLKKNHYGNYALFSFYVRYRFYGEIEEQTTFARDTFIFVIQEYIEEQVGGEFAIGGLFNSARDDVQNYIYGKWEKYSPSLQRAISELQSTPPLLHAAIIAKAPRRIIANITDCFDCIHIRDSLGRNPIDVAVEEDLEWNKGMQDVIEAMAAKEQCSTTHITAKYGLPWKICMRHQLINSNTEEVINGTDRTTGLCLFMLAAMGDKSDLSVIYYMMKMNPNQSKCDK